MGDSSQVREAADSDSDAIAAVWLRSRRASVPQIPEPVHSDEEVREWVANVLVPGGGTWVAVTEVGVVGMMTVRDGSIDQLYVDPGHLGQGTGTTLLEHAKRLHPGGLDLWTFQSNARARRFYEAHGFLPLEETGGDNEERAPDIRYHWGAPSRSLTN
jgi:ribosomal protein S18 acetylase RimI-like enzyme